jgi:hypothetical protein
MNRQNRQLDRREFLKLTAQVAAAAAAAGTFPAVAPLVARAGEAVPRLPSRISYFCNGEIHVNQVGKPEGKPLTTGHQDFKPSWSKAIAAAAPPRRPGAIECETMKVRSRSGDFFVGDQDMDPFGGERWSGGHHLLGKATAVGDWVEIEWPAHDAGPRKLMLYATQASDYGELRFRINGREISAKFDGYADTVKPAPAFVPGTFEPRDGKFILRIEVAGANALAKGAKYHVGLDCVTMEKP